MTVTPRNVGDLLTATIFNTKLEAPVLAAELGDNQVTSSKLAPGAVGTPALAAGAVTAAKLASLPQCVVRHTANQAIASGVDTALAFNTEIIDTDNMHDTVNNNDRITIVTPGLYFITYVVSFASNPSGYRAVTVFDQADTGIARTILAPVNGEHTEVCGSAYARLAGGDYIRLRAYQNSGSSLTCDALAVGIPQFGARWVNQ